MGAESFLNPIGIGLGIVGSIGKLLGNGKANRELRELQASDPNYATSAAGIANNKIASGRLALAQTLLNSRMPGSQSVERNIYGTAANSISQINRNATDSATALALGSGVQSQENAAFDKLGLDEANDYQRRYGNYTGAQEGMINEGDKVFQDETRRWQDKVQIGGAINQNRQNNWGSISNGGFALANVGINGGFGGFNFGGNGGGANAAGRPRTH